MRTFRQCSSCGTQLAEDMAYCPTCGTLIPRSGAAFGIVSDGPTEASPPPGPQPYKPATDYGSPPYGAPLQNPYEPLHPNSAPPPPSLRKVSRRTVLVGLTVGGVLVVGGGLLWLASSQQPTAKFVGQSSPTPNGQTASHKEGSTMGQTVVLECLGNIEGFRFLDGRTGGQVGLAPSNIEAYSGTFWDLEKLSDGTYSFKCLGASIPRDGAAYLDGRTADGSVGLAPNTNPPYTGTHWQLNPDSNGFFTIVFANRYLNGRTGDGGVDLAPNPAPPATGTRWAIYTKLSL